MEDPGRRGGGTLPAHRRVAVLGGVYSNWLALEAALDDARAREVDAVYCLGDLGAFGPHPDRTVEVLRDREIPVLRGNYDDSLARGLDDCQCGYTDPRDNHYARLSYRYTFAHTHPDHRRWMGTLPGEIRFRLGVREVLCCHGSPRRTNEFLWESTTPTHFLRSLARDHGADVILGTHTGIPWVRRWNRGEDRVPWDVGRDAAEGGGEGLYVNVGALGRPANDGRTEVWYALLEAGGGEGSGGSAGPGDADVSVELVPVVYDHERLAHAMRAEELAEEFVETILTGWWTTCLEVLPGKERARGRH